MVCFGYRDAAFGALEDDDQWTVPNGLDAHRPLYRIALNDDAGTELYVSSKTGEVVRDTTRQERTWNYLGSVAHWIYPTVLRRNWHAWDATVWTLSIAAALTALAGALLGLLRLKNDGGRIMSPFRGWHVWHCAPIITHNIDCAAVRNRLRVQHDGNRDRLAPTARIV